MSTAHEAAARLPEPTELRLPRRALAVLDATIEDDRRRSARRPAAVAGRPRFP
ncbi:MULTISPECIES: hypothetical protein [unclassified Streptomyces]|uniref:hypothetical protein n=1 Tax=unclassified Streptomyces TaxID=2593676 RepID=UPI00331DA86C